MRRQQELETRQKLSSVLGESRTTVVAAAEDKEELERLAQRLRSAEDDAARLRAVLRDQVREQFLILLHAFPARGKVRLQTSCM